MITIAVDAMGGDHAPRPEVEGSVLAARELGIRILLVGQPQVVRTELARHAAPNLPIEIVAGNDQTTMHYHPSHAFRPTQDSSKPLQWRLGAQTMCNCLANYGDTATSLP